MAASLWRVFECVLHCQRVPWPLAWAGFASSLCRLVRVCEQTSTSLVVSLLELGRARRLLRSCLALQGLHPLPRRSLQTALLQGAATRLPPTQGPSPEKSGGQQGDPSHLLWPSQVEFAAVLAKRSIPDELQNRETIFDFLLSDQSSPLLTSLIYKIWIF